MLNPGNYPFVRLLIPLMAGIILHSRCNDYPGIIKGMLAIIFAGYLLIIFRKNIISYALRWIPGVLITCFMMVMGMALGFYKDTVNWESHYLHHVNDSAKVVVLGSLNDHPIETANSYKVEIALEMVSFHNDENVPVMGSVLCYFQKDTAAEQLAAGDKIWMKGYLNPIKPSANPESFDYRSFMYRKGITHQMYLIPGSYIRSGKINRAFPENMILWLRNSLIAKVRNASLHEQNRAIALAILLGFKDDLDPVQQQRFAAAGAVHILCVSGLHVGIVFLLGSSLLKPLKRYRKGQVLYYMSAFLLIWFFALITGMSPSVTRASVMFSFVLTGQAFGRKQHVINAVAASAFLLLVINPFWLFNPGFQLSYLAVTGIVILHKPLASIWNPEAKILQKVRDLLIISFVAQLFTAPLAVFYFHQFPNYFLITNLMVIPLTGLLLYFGLAFLIIPASNLLFEIVSRLFDAGLTLLNFSVELVEKLPYASAKDLYLTPISVIFLYCVVIVFSGFAFSKSKQWLIGLFVVINLLMASFMLHMVQRNANDTVIIYHVNKATVIDAVKGNSVISISLGVTEPKQLEYAVSGFRRAAGIDKNAVTEVALTRILEENLPLSIQINDVDMLLLGRSCRSVAIAEKADFHFVILHNNPKVEIADIVNAFPGATVIIDGSNAYYTARAWETAADKISIWNTNNKGALVLSR